jgi:hypothetical protein
VSVGDVGDGGGGGGGGEAAACGSSDVGVDGVGDSVGGVLALAVGMLVLLVLVMVLAGCLF